MHDQQKENNNIVAPLVGAWIEITINSEQHPDATVAPLVGAWIEINVATQTVAVNGRSSRGSVD